MKHQTKGIALYNLLNWNLVTEDQVWQTSGSSEIVKELEHRWLTK